MADQLQSNFATDLRSILKVVFLINASRDDDEEEEEEKEAEDESAKVKTVSESSSVEEAIEAHESFVEEEEEDEEEQNVGGGGRSEGVLPSMTSLFPLPIEESPSHQPGIGLRWSFSAACVK